MTHLILPYFAIALSACAEQHSLPSLNQSTPDTTLGVTGALKRFDKFSLTNVDARNIDVWLPPDYDKDSTKRYAVILRHGNARPNLRAISDQRSSP